MNAEDALLIAITSHTNSYLKRGTGFRGFRRDPVAQALGDIHFILAVEGMAMREIAASPEDWAAWLKKENCKGLRLLRSARPGALPGTLSAAFANNSDWVIESLMPDGTSGFWLPHWENTETARNGWNTTYACRAKLPTEAQAPPSLDDALAVLITSLEEIHAFAVKQERDNFADIFASALKQARQAIRMKNGRGFWDSGPLSRKAQKAMDAAQSAHVFGGMGSWNDIVCDGEDGVIYDRVSGNLFQAMNGVMEAAVNAGD